MFSENLKILRKKRGMSQETLAQQLNVVRQTISKWEKGLSVPDAEMLSRIAELFEVSVSDLLGEKIQAEQDYNEIAAQLAVLNEQLAIRNRRNRAVLRVVKIVLGVILAIIIFIVGLNVAGIALYGARIDADNGELSHVDMICELNGETYEYGVTFDEQYRVIEAGGNAWISDHVQTEQYGDANVLMAQIEDYFTDRGGSVEYVGDSEL